MRVGTLVMLNMPAHMPRAEGLPPNGAIGEVVEVDAWLQAEIPVGNVAVDFPRNPSNSTSKLWNVWVKWLIPISDPDIEIEDYEDCPAEENSEMI